jgi:uncharacterized protein
MDANIKTIRDCYEAFARGDIPFILGCCAADVDWQSSDSPEIPYSGRYRGPAGAAQFFQKIAAALDIKAFQPSTFMASGNEVMTTGSWSGIAKSTGKTFMAQWAMRFVFDRNGKVTLFRPYEDTAQIAAALRR